jgi:hypothetical protein
MLLPSELIKQLERYKQMYAKRREVLSDKLAAIQKEKKQLMEEKQNLYCLTSVIIHEGTAGTPNPQKYRFGPLHLFRVGQQQTMDQVQ